MIKQLGSDSDGGCHCETSNGFIIISCPHMHDYQIHIGGINDRGEKERATAYFNAPAGGYSPNGWKYSKKALIALAEAVKLDHEEERKLNENSYS